MMSVVIIRVPFGIAAHSPDPLEESVMRNGVPQSSLDMPPLIQRGRANELADYAGRLGSGLAAAIQELSRLVERDVHYHRQRQIHFHSPPSVQPSVQKC